MGKGCLEKGNIHGRLSVSRTPYDLLSWDSAQLNVCWKQSALWATSLRGLFLVWNRYLNRTIARYHDPGSDVPRRRYLPNS
jgi:hypothetical protein